jgi:DNA adenine methylase
MTNLNPPLKWAGGKRWLVPELRYIWQNYQKNRLVELFCGGLSISLGLRPKEALLNDINPHLINFYVWMQRGLNLDFKSTDNNSSLFYERRERFNELINNFQHNTEEAAQLFYFLNRTGFNGLCRFNKEGKFNVPFGKYSKINYMTTSEAKNYIPVLSGWVFSQGDFSDVHLMPNDFVYADPPYDVPFTQYSPDGFSWKDQIRLIERLSYHSGPVIISNQATDRIVDLYTSYGFDIKFVTAPRMISSNGNRAPAKEILATKNLHLENQPLKQLNLF